MPTEITGQNGAVIEQETNIAISDCGGVLPSKSAKQAKPTRAQLLAKALKSCRKKYAKKTEKTRRVACEKAARKKYGPKTKAAKKSAHKAKRAAAGRG